MGNSIENGKSAGSKKAIPWWVWLVIAVIAFFVKKAFDISRLPPAIPIVYEELTQLEVDTSDLPSFSNPKRAYKFFEIREGESIYQHGEIFEEILEIYQELPNTTEDEALGESLAKRLDRRVQAYYRNYKAYYAIIGEQIAYFSQEEFIDDEFAVGARGYAERYGERRASNLQIIAGIENLLVALRSASPDQQVLANEAVQQYLDEWSALKAATDPADREWLEYIDSIGMEVDDEIFEYFDN